MGSKVSLREKAVMLPCGVEPREARSNNPTDSPAYKHATLSPHPSSLPKPSPLPSSSPPPPPPPPPLPSPQPPSPAKMKTILASETMEIPEEVTVKVSAKMISVTGPRGTLTRNFKHLNLDFQLQEGGRKLKVDAWFGTRKTMAAIRTAISHVQNLITGVTKGFRYKMRFVYAHFPINASITAANRGIEIRNFLGEKKVRKVDMLDGVTILRSEKVKDEIVLDGNDIELVSRSAALINQKCHVKNKDIRKFLDGIYVSDKGAIKEE
ncbi:hypothetical protein CFC21_106478 [Triticum aestivum]|uniref:Large ribosomal subunit protein uL6 alpha-beta domain-containing protein n=7 Tax=Triticinae TaxID=1648030 RepID=A0A9R1N9M4_WHEAT|nr:hypothetical protein CFC21_106478 [Triticum aestivum]